MVGGDLRADARHRSGAGQSLAEFSLVLVPLALLLLGAIQFGVIWATQVGVTNAVRDAARTASITQPKSGDNAGTVTSTSETSFANSIIATVLDPALQKNVPFYSPTAATKRVCYASFTDVAGATSLQVTVAVTYAHPIFIPLISWAVGGNTLSTVSSLTIPVGMDSPFALPSPLPSPPTPPVPGCST